MQGESRSRNFFTLLPSNCFWCHFPKRQLRIQMEGFTNTEGGEGLPGRFERLLADPLSDPSPPPRAKAWPFTPRGPWLTAKAMVPPPAHRSTSTVTTSPERSAGRWSTTKPPGVRTYTNTRAWKTVKRARGRGYCCGCCCNC